jgi:hypothetical protein
MSPSVNSAVSPNAERDSAGVDAILARIGCCVKAISLEFGQWDDPRAKGPGLYFVIEHDSTAEFAAPMGANRWPVEDCTSVFDGIDALFETAQSVAYACDGAVIVHSDGRIEAQMVRLDQLSTADGARPDTLPYAEWMGTRHMSALETSTREAVFAVVTLSEEDGRVTIFTDGTFEDVHRDALGDGWQPAE